MVQRTTLWLHSQSPKSSSKTVLHQGRPSSSEEKILDGKIHEEELAKNVVLQEEVALQGNEHSYRN